jgi:hypothetical protein
VAGPALARPRLRRHTAGILEELCHVLDLQPAELFNPPLGWSLDRLEIALARMEMRLKTGEYPV